MDFKKINDVLLSKEESPMYAVEASMVAVHGQDYANHAMFSTNALEIAKGMLMCAAVSDQEPIQRRMAHLAELLIIITAKLGREFCEVHGKKVESFQADMEAFGSAGRTEMDEIKRRAQPKGAQ